MFTYDDVLRMICSLYECASPEAFVELYNFFVTLHEHGLISDECWRFFSLYGEPLYFDRSLNRVVSGRSF